MSRRILSSGWRMQRDTEREAKKIGGVGIVTDADLARFSAAEQRLFHAMAANMAEDRYGCSVGPWFNDDALFHASGRQAGYKRRMRALRRLPGVTIEKCRNEDGGNTWRYRLVIDPPDAPQQSEMFT